MYVLNFLVNSSSSNQNISSYNSKINCHNHFFLCCLFISNQLCS